MFLMALVDILWSIRRWYLLPMELGWSWLLRPPNLEWRSCHLHIYGLTLFFFREILPQMDQYFQPFGWWLHSPRVVLCVFCWGSTRPTAPLKFCRMFEWSPTSGRLWTLSHAMQKLLTWQHVSHARPLCSLVSCSTLCLGEKKKDGGWGSLQFFEIGSLESNNRILNALGC